ncbi:MAG: hypothetical protein LBL20_05680 [Treponema sp.]|nr:hypothetical protein [Treponema sp.]
MNSMNFDAAAFLRALATLPAGGPRPALLPGIAALSAARPEALPAVRAGMRGERLDRRYLRIRAVQDELGKLDFEKAKPGVPLDDFVFEQTDFSIYKKIGAGEFSLFGKGLDDFDDAFYTGYFRMDRKKTASVIGSAYKRIGAFYYLNQEKHLRNPLLMAVMRTLHTSLAFRPIVSINELLAEFTGVVRYLSANKVVGEEVFLPALQNFNAVYRALLELLDGSAVLHGDGMTTNLVAESPAGEKPPALKGVFHPRDKAYTMRLAGE